MEIPAIIKQCEALGVQSLAITDHLNTLEKAELHIPILEDIKKLDTSIEVYFAVELNYTGCDEEFVYSEEIRDKYGFQFAIGGIHNTYCEEYDIQKIVDIQHRHHIKTCQDPLVDILVHPYWFGKGEYDKKGWTYFNTMKDVPESYARELGQASRDTGTAIELNGGAILDNANYDSGFVEEYFEYISIIADEGAIFAVGSDAHDINRLQTVNRSWEFFDRLNIPEDRLWRPSMAPIIRGK